MWRNTALPVRIVFLDGRACLPLLVFVVYWSWATFYIAIGGMAFFHNRELGGAHGRLGPAAGSPLVDRPGADRCAGLEAPEVLHERRRQCG